MNKCFAIVAMAFSLLLTAGIGPAYAQFGASSLEQRFAAFSDADARGDINRAADIAQTLAYEDFSALALPAYEIRALRSGLADTQAAAGRYDDAAHLYRQIIMGDQRAYSSASTASESAQYRQDLIDHLMRLVTIDTQRRDGDAIIGNLLLVLGLMEDQLGTRHPDSVQTIDRLVHHLRGRADHFNKTQRSQYAFNDLMRAEQLLRQRYPSEPLNTTELENQILDTVRRATIQHPDKDASIRWLTSTRDQLIKQLGEGSPIIWPVTELLASEYQSRSNSGVVDYRNFSQSENDMVTARRLILRQYGTDWEPYRRINIAFARRLLEWAAYFFEIEQPHIAYRLATDAESLRVSDASLVSNIRAFREKAYRSAYQIPGNQPVNIPAAGRYLDEAPVEYVTVPGQYAGQVGGEQEEKFESVRVFYGTNRVESLNPFTGDTVGDLRYGWAHVTVPKNRQAGGIQRPLPLFSPKDDLHIILNRVTNYSGPNRFGRRLHESVRCARFKFYQDGREPKCTQRTLGSDEPKELFVFVHGHGVSFAHAARRTAQLAVDLDIRHGAVFFDWPAAGVAFYGRSKKRADASVNDLSNFLNTVISGSKADKIHIIAHSMGNRVLLNSLKQIAGQHSLGSKPVFDQLIFASPDVDKSEFSIAVKATEHLSNGMTLYGSKGDVALGVSGIVNRESRAGWLPAHPDIINASVKLVAVDTAKAKERVGDAFNHSDYVGSLIEDVQSVLWTSAKPTERCFLQETSAAAERPYWLAEPNTAGCPIESFGLALSANRTLGQVSANVEIDQMIQKQNDPVEAQKWILAKYLLPKVPSASARP